MPGATASASLAEHAYTILRDRLVMLDISPGAPLSESELASELQVGRTPLREALKRLATDHLVEFFPRRGTFATRADIGELKNITEMRVILEPAGALKAARNATAAQREALYALATEIGELGRAQPSARTLLTQDLEVHRSIYRLVDNAYMRETLFRLDNLATRLWWSVIHHVPSVIEHIAGHRAMLIAVADGAEAKAAELAREHVTEFHQQLQRELIASVGGPPQEVGAAL